MGSPPHMRGKALQLCHTPPPSGITPAHAGKSAQDLAARYSRGDHPRTCGEKLGIVTDPTTEGGITPAHAGKRQIRI